MAFMINLRYQEPVEVKQTCRHSMEIWSSKVTTSNEFAISEYSVTLCVIQFMQWKDKFHFILPIQLA